MNISTITTYLHFTVAVHSSDNHICAQIWYCISYYEYPCHQQPKQTMEIRTILIYLLFTVSLYYSEDETLVNLWYCTPYCVTSCLQQPKQSRKEAPPVLIIFLQSFCFCSWGPNKGINNILNTLLCYLRRAITQTKHEHKHHHYLLTFHSSCAFFWVSNRCTNMI